MEKSRFTEVQIVGILKGGVLNRERVHRVCRALRLKLPQLFIIRK